MKMPISIDGFVSDANGKNDWVFKTGDEESLAWSVGAVRQAGLIIMGRKSFEGLAPYWPTAPGPFAAPGKPIVAIGGAGFMRSLILTSHSKNLPSGVRHIVSIPRQARYA